MTWHYIVWFSDWNRFKSWIAFLACSRVTDETGSISQRSLLFWSKVVVIYHLFVTYEYFLSYNGACMTLTSSEALFKYTSISVAPEMFWQTFPVNILPHGLQNGFWSLIFFLSPIFMLVLIISACCCMELWVTTNSIINAHGFQRNS